MVHTSRWYPPTSPPANVGFRSTFFWGVLVWTIFLLKGPGPEREVSAANWWEGRFHVSEPSGEWHQEKTSPKQGPHLRREWVHEWHHSAMVALRCDLVVHKKLDPWRLVFHLLQIIFAFLWFRRESIATGSMFCYTPPPRKKVD